MPSVACGRHCRSPPAPVLRGRCPAGARPGAERLPRAFGAWFDYMADDRRGCFLTSVATEFDDRPGPVRDAVIAALSRWSAYVLDELGAALE
ncbi:TetR family transcriptional regulator C-terminal domain-containing protein [Streptosporangium minutum]|uniref:TetR family transcriptional regulator C-terminal domain-containing protein n=1 Tax=Streptosporangium minutum TaxID=569862 RepID=UPI001A9803A2|nr:hypothetical protein [Streptosporangium minutum]